MFLMRAETPQVERGSPDQLGLKRGTEKPDLVASVLLPPRRIVAAPPAKTSCVTFSTDRTIACMMVVYFCNLGTVKV
jgi:hypothetical protein